MDTDDEWARRTVNPTFSLSDDPHLRGAVVVGFDGSRSSERALAYGAGMARRQDCGLVIVHVAPQPTVVLAGCQPPTLMERSGKSATTLAGELSEGGQLDGLTWVLLERNGDVCRELASVCAECRANALVVGATHGRIRRSLLSVSGRLNRMTRQLLVVVP